MTMGMGSRTDADLLNPLFPTARDSLPLATCLWCAERVFCATGRPEHIRARHRHRSTNKALTEDEQSSDTTLLQEVHALLQTALIGSIGEIIAQGLQTIFLDLPADAENQMSDMFGEESDFDALAQVLRKVPL